MSIAKSLLALSSSLDDVLFNLVINLLPDELLLERLPSSALGPRVRAALRPGRPDPGQHLL
ncbi:MAG: hypothetical protein MZU79_07060 [Anaerotruncus sp.]|nr:hypothetical protein [Anaerotruncus sp.]